MASNSCTFIIVPDATSQCKRYTISKSILWVIGICGTGVFLVLGGILYSMLSEYKAMSMKAGELEKLKKISLSQRSTIERYEQDITQVSKHLAMIKQLNSRLMILTGLDPAKSSGNLGLGGSEEAETLLEVQEAQGASSK